MIRLNLSTDYALRTLLYLGSHPEQQVAIRTIAEFHGISADHVSKVVQQLAHAGMIRSERGRTGGIRLGRPPERITVWDVVELFEGPVALLECVQGGGSCVLRSDCRLQDLLARVGMQLVRELKAVTLADLAAPADQPLVQLTT
jgi:Rrf2 family transcriptional regulator, nitric oxide-sensitive transcriptional repressor